MKVIANGVTAPAPAPQAPNAPSAPAPAAIRKIDVPSDSPAKGGKAGAKVTIVEWSDFQCPFCSRAAETVKQIEANYGRDIRLVYKHNPLPMHPNAPAAAEAALAAGKQGKFWEMHDKLFESTGKRQPLTKEAIA